MKNYFIIGLMFFLFSCKAEGPQPLFSGEKPENITDYTVKNLPGAARISYHITDSSTLYVKAIYHVKDDDIREAKSSRYNNSLLVNAFPSSDDYEVKLYAVGMDEKISDPVIVTVHPLKPPYLKAFESIQLDPTFSGGRIQLENKDLSNLMVGIVTLDYSSGNWVDAHKEFVSSEDVDFSFRGFKSIKTKFGIYVRDEWLNYSDTLFKEITPYNEVAIDMSNMKEVTLPGDAGLRKAADGTKALFDGKKGTSSTGFYSDNSQGTPQHVTIKLPDTYQLSRFRMWMNYSAKYAYSSSQPKRIRIWGSMDPNPNGDFDSTWYVLKVFDDWKPSGKPVGENTEEDVAVAEAGNEFVFDLDTKPANYIRFETLETWDPSTHVYITELALWGGKVD